MVWVLWLATCCNPQLCASEHRDVGKGEAKGKVGKISGICQQEGGKRNLDPGSHKGHCSMRAAQLPHSAGWQGWALLLSWASLLLGAVRKCS